MYMMKEFTMGEFIVIISHQIPSNLSTSTKLPLKIELFTKNSLLISYLRWSVRLKIQVYQLVIQAVRLLEKVMSTYTGTIKANLIIIIISSSSGNRGSTGSCGDRGADVCSLSTWCRLSTTTITCWSSLHTAFYNSKNIPHITSSKSQHALPV